MQVVPSVVKVMKQENVFPVKNTLKKFTIWEINRDKDILKEDFQAFSRVLITNKDSGDHTLAINSTKTWVDLLTGKSNKGLISFKGLLCWRRL